MCPTGRPGPGTGDRPVTGLWFFVKISSLTMPDSETEDDGWEQGSRDEEQSEEGADLRCENSPANRSANRETGLEMPCFPPSDQLWVQITQSYPNRLRFSRFTLSSIPLSRCN
jgi:hypothetical protein